MDDLSRERLAGGSLAAPDGAGWHVTRVTANPAIFARAITDSDAYAAQIADLAPRRNGAGAA